MNGYRKKSFSSLSFGSQSPFLYNCMPSFRDWRDLDSQLEKQEQEREEKGLFHPPSVKRHFTGKKGSPLLREAPLSLFSFCQGILACEGPPSSLPLRISRAKTDATSLFLSSLFLCAWEEEEEEEEEGGIVVGSVAAWINEGYDEASTVLYFIVYELDGLLPLGFTAQLNLSLAIEVHTL